MHLSHYTDAPCGSTPLESSAGYKLLEFGVDANKTPSVALIDYGAFHCFAYEFLVKTAI